MSLKAQINMCQSIRFLDTTYTRMGFVYSLDRADFSHKVLYIPTGAADPCELIAEAMEVRSPRYLLVAPEHTSDGIIAKLRDSAGSETVIRERAGWLYVIERAKL